MSDGATWGVNSGPRTTSIGAASHIPCRPHRAPAGAFGRADCSDVSSIVERSTRVKTPCAGPKGLRNQAEELMQRDTRVMDQLRFVALPLLGQAPVGIRRRHMRGVGASHVVAVHRWIAGIVVLGWARGARFQREALLAGPRSEQRPVDREAPVRLRPARVRLTRPANQERHHHVSGERAVAIPGVHRGMSDWGVQPEPDNPAEHGQEAELVIAQQLLRLGDLVRLLVLPSPPLLQFVGEVSPPAFRIVRPSVASADGSSPPSPHLPPLTPIQHPRHPIALLCTLPRQQLP